MCQIDSQYMLTSNFSCFCVLVTVVRVFTASTPEEAQVPLNCDRFARSSCANAFCRHVPALEWPTGMIASRDYCHAPLGVSSFSFSIQNVWEMTTVVDKIACRSCTVCPPPMVLRLFIADTIGFTTVYS